MSTALDKIISRQQYNIVQHSSIQEIQHLGTCSTENVSDTIRARQQAKGYLCVCQLTVSLLEGLKDGIRRDQSVLVNQDVDEVDEELRKLRFLCQIIYYILFLLFCDDWICQKTPQIIILLEKRLRR